MLIFLYKYYYMKEPPKILVDAFLKAINDVKNITITPDNDTLLKLYGYYKQSNEGDNKMQCPSLFDLRGNAKWNSWLKLKGMSKETAMVKYIKLVNTLI